MDDKIPDHDSAADAGDVTMPEPLEHDATTRQADVSDAGDGPPAGTLLARIVDYLEKSERPRRGWQIERDLKLTRQPSAQLSRLVAQGHIKRVREGIYGVTGRDYGTVSLSEGL
jgi:hypothetical protein